MNVKAVIAIATVAAGLSTTSVATELGQLRAVSWQSGTQSSRTEGQKTGWNDGSLPPAQAKKESKKWQKEHKREAKRHRKEARARQKEARSARRRSHPAVVHKQPESPVNPQKSLQNSKINAAKQANKEHRQEVQHQ